MQCVKITHCLTFTFVIMVINSIIDNDLYKFTMQYAAMNLFPFNVVKYQFTNRGEQKFPEGFDKLVMAEVNKMTNLQLQPDEYAFLKEKCYYLPQAYLDFLSGYRFNPEEVKILQTGGDLKIEIEGFWYRTILWEVPLMAIVSQLYFENSNQSPWNQNKIDDVLNKKIELYKHLGIKVADFGTRRRFSFENHNRVVGLLKLNGGDTFVGTSNVYLAMKHDSTPIGTHAHEWFMFHAALFGYKIANSVALENWVKIYRGNLGIALTDTFTSDVFFRSFDTLYAKLFDGVRHDSGDPLVFAEKTIEHYKKLRINPLTKTIVFSDALDPIAVERIVEYCRGKILMSFGIGTNFTNDVGVKPLNMVIKLSKVKAEKSGDWFNCVKLSDNVGKHTGNPEEISSALFQLGIDR